MNKYYIPIHLHSHFSLQDSIAQPEDIIKRCKEINSDCCGISDHGTLSGIIQHIKECKNENIKPLIGIEAYICNKHSSIRDNTNRDLSHLLIYANNDNGWKNLLKMMAESSHPDNYYYKCRISLEQLSKYKDLSIINGHLGSSIGDALYNDDYETAKKIAKYCKDIWGENFWLEAQSITTKCLPKTIKILTFIRKLGKELGIKCLATADSHYVWSHQQPLQNILLAKSLGGITLEELKNSGMKTFAECSDFFIPDYQEMVSYGSTEEELENTIKFAERISEYKDILRSPMLPQFVCPNGYNVNTWLRELCRNGWRNKIQNIIPKNDQQVYIDRIKHELQVFEGANLAGYFLIVEDILRYADKIGCLRSPGRGSVGGCLTAYLLGISQVNPIKYNLLFSRFYDESRKGSLPDIDLDFPKHKREQIIQYIKDKYGKENVAQIATYQTMKGRAALKDVFRAYGNISVEEQNRLTKFLPDPAKVAGELQEMEEEEGGSSLILYTLENDRKLGRLKEWCFLDDNNELKGPLAKQFEQAIKMEGTKVAQSKHAAGVVISPVPLNEVCPLTYDTKTKSQICSLALDDSESVGLMKLDVLGIITIDKLMDIANCVANNEAC